MTLRQVGPSLASSGGGGGRGRDAWATVGVLGHKAIIAPGAGSSSSTSWSAWTVSDLAGAEVRVALFGSAAAAHYATAEGTALVLVGCRPSRHKEGGAPAGGRGAAPVRGDRLGDGLGDLGVQDAHPVGQLVAGVGWC